MMRGADHVTNDLRRELYERLRRRTWKGGAYWYLDLRTKRYPSHGILVVRDPEGRGWPEIGETTTSKRDAMRWVDAYVDRLGGGWFTGDATLRTVAEVAATYLAELEKSAPPNTVINRTSNLKRHVIPAFGDQPLEALSGSVVQEWISGLLTVRGRPMKRATKQTVLAALGEVWKHAHPGRPAPWRGQVTIEVTGGALARRLRAQTGERRQSGRAYTVEELRNILEVAFELDRAAFKNAKKNRAVPDVAYVIATLFYTGARVEEMTFLRRQDVHVGQGVIFVPGTKSAAAERFVPIQQAFRSWLHDLLARAGDEPLALLFTNSAAKGPAMTSTIQGRVREVLEAASLKRPGKATHILRASHITIGRARGVAKADMDRFMGHFDGSIADKHYMDSGVFAASLRPEHFCYLPALHEPVGRRLLLDDRRRRVEWRSMLGAQ
jgi:integrase